MVFIRVSIYFHNDPDVLYTGNFKKTCFVLNVSILFDDTPEMIDTGNLLKIMIFISVSIHFDDAPEVFAMLAFPHFGPWGASIMSSRHRFHAV